MTWRSRGYLPHVEAGGAPQMVTYRLADALPAEVLAGWRAELARLPEDRQTLELRKRVQEYLDRSRGNCWLNVPAVAEVVGNAFLHHDGDRYQLHAWVVMPNHVHVLISPTNGWTLSNIIKTWKGFTARRANEILGLRGAFWQPEYFDRVIRNETHFQRAMEYIEHNPLKAGLCESPTMWPFGSARLLPRE